MKQYRYLFGPVPSRRFGLSLGVDLTPLKTCSFDCVFCQLGRTKTKTITPVNHVPVNEVILEIQDWISQGGTADYITLSGSGEPTLHSEFGVLLEFLKTVPFTSVLLTNGSTLSSPEICRSASMADIVKVSLSCWDQNSFDWVNRPHKELNFAKLIQGIKQFREGYHGKLWAEVFILSGINSNPESVQKIATHLKDLGPDHIHLNTISRPPAEDFAEGLQKEKMISLVKLFKPVAEVITDFNKKKSKKIAVDQGIILSMLQRRPCTTNDIAEAFTMHVNEVSKYLGALIRSNKIHSIRKKDAVYYSAINNHSQQFITNEKIRKFSI